MISGKKFNEGLKWLKENYNLKDFSPVTTKAWFEILKSESITDEQFTRCIRIIIKTIPNWYQAGESLASRVLSVLPEVKRDMRSEREDQKALAEAKVPKQLPEISEAEAEHNREKLKYMLELQKTLKIEPRRPGESSAEWLERKHLTFEEKLTEFDKKLLEEFGKNGN